MAETVLQLKKIGQNRFGALNPAEPSSPWVPAFNNDIAWRFAFNGGIAFHKGNPVFNYAVAFTYIELLDLRQMTLSLINGTEQSDTPSLLNITLQGVLGSWGCGRGSVSAASKEHADIVGAPFEMKSLGSDPEFDLELTIDAELFPPTRGVLTLSEEKFAGTMFRARERFSG